MLICVAIEYGKTSPKLLRWLSPDPTGEEKGHPSDSNGSNHGVFGRRDSSGGDDADDEDEDVAAEARRVEGLADGRMLGDGGGEVILNKLRKVYRAKQVKSGTCIHRLSLILIIGGCWLHFCDHCGYWRVAAPVVCRA